MPNCERFGQLQAVRAAETSKVPVAPMGHSSFALSLQGGGVYVSSGTATITSSSIYGNTAYYVRAHVQKFPSPLWETHVCLLFAGRRCLRRVRHGHDNVFLDLREYSFLCPCSCSKVPIITMGDHVSLIVFGRLTFCLLFAGRWCPPIQFFWWHSVNRELPDLLQHSYLCAR